MAPARIARARIVILTAGLVGTLTSRVPAVEPDQVLELRMLTYAALETAEVQIAIQTAQPLLASGGIQTECASAWATTAALDPPAAVLSSACTCFPS